MVQFNLLPDVKLSFIKAEHQKHLVVSISMIASIAAISVMVFLGVTVKLWQQKSLNDLAKDIKENTSVLQANKEINNMLTVQSQLTSLNSLHDSKPIASRIYSYIKQVTPSEASISSINIDFSSNSLEMSGKVSSLAIVQKFADTLKFTTYRLADKQATDTSADPAVFANVVLSTFARQKDSANYTMTMSFDPVIFSNTKKSEIKVPAINSTDTSQVRPTALFQPIVTGEGQ